MVPWVLRRGAAGRSPAGRAAPRALGMATGPCPGPHPCRGVHPKPPSCTPQHNPGVPAVRHLLPSSDGQGEGGGTGTHRHIPVPFQHPHPNGSTSPAGDRAWGPTCSRGGVQRRGEDAVPGLPGGLGESLRPPSVPGWRGTRSVLGGGGGAGRGGRGSQLGLRVGLASLLSLTRHSLDLRLARDLQLGREAREPQSPSMEGVGSFPAGAQSGRRGGLRMGTTPPGSLGCAEVAWGPRGCVGSIPSLGGCRGQEGPRAAPHWGGLRGGGVLPKGPQGSPSRLPSPRRWESELRLFSAESWSVLTKLCLRRDGAQPPSPPLPGAGWGAGRAALLPPGGYLL